MYCRHSWIALVGVLAWPVGAATIGCQSGAPGQVLTCGTAGVSAWRAPAAETDPVFLGAPAAGITALDLSRWANAYTLAASALQVETDPLFATSAAAGITAADKAHWATAYGWGNHAAAGYAVATDLGSAAYASTTAFDPAGAAAAITLSGLGAGSAATHAAGDFAAAGHTQAWSTITATPSTLVGYGITDARGLSDTSSIIFGRDTDSIAVNDSYTIAWPVSSTFTAVVCDVMTAPVGAAIGIDVRAGSPLTSIYTSGHALVIPAGATSTLSGDAPILVTSPVPISARQPVQIIVTGVGLSEPGQGLRCTIQEALPCC